MSPWIDFRLPPKDIKLAAVEAQKHRRFVKTHLPVDALVYSPNAKYIYMAATAVTSCGASTNHHAMGNDAMYDALEQQPRPGGPAARASAG